VSRQSVSTLPIVSYPEGIDSDGQSVWVVSWMDESLVGIDAVTLATTVSVPLGRNPRGFGRFVLAQ
jgi:YVTN family beta-propeller protein